MKRAFMLAAPGMALLAWLAYAVAGHRLALWIARRWGPQIVRAGDGKFSDAALFVQHRFYEGAWLLSMSIIVLALALTLGALTARRLPALWKWIPYSAAAFAGLNVWIKLAGSTCLFWCLFWNGKGLTDNFTQFHIKLRLLDENPAPVKVVLAGSSQVRAQIDPRILNRELLPEIFSTELHFPGSRGYDFLALDNELAGHQVDVVVCYLSELYFFGNGFSPGFPFFFTVTDWPEFKRLGGKLSADPESARYAVLGSLLPVFRLRDSLTQRFLGDAVGLRLKEPVWSPAADLNQRAVEMAAPYQTNSLSQFNVAGFEAFVAHCRARNRLAVLCWGQANPLLARTLDPALRPEVHAFLRSLARRYDNVVLLEPPSLPVQTAADYDDLTHANRAAEVRYTEALAPFLRQLAERKKNVSSAATPAKAP